MVAGSSPTLLSSSGKLAPINAAQTTTAETAMPMVAARRVAYAVSAMPAASSP